MSEVNGQTFPAKLGQLGRMLCQKLRDFFTMIRHALIRFGRFLKRSWKKFLRRFAKWIDPKLEPYRIHRSPSSTSQTTPNSPSRPEPATNLSFHSEATSPTKIKQSSTSPSPASRSHHLHEFETPATRADLLTIIGSVPFGVLSKRERETITNLLELPDRKIQDIILPKSKIVYVAEDEVLGPLTLDRLYRSGLAHFPVTNSTGDIIGILHTAHLNSLEIRETSRADQLLDPNLFYIRTDYTFTQALDAFLRTSSQLLIVVDHYGRVSGLLTFCDFCQVVFGQAPDDFDRDNDRLAVAKRRE